MIKVMIFILFAEVLTAIGQVLLKKSANSLEMHSLRGAGGFASFIKEILSVPNIWYGLSAMAIGLVIWIMALAQADLNLVFSLGSIQYVMILLLAHFMLGEKIDKMKLLGTFLVIFGIFLITIS